MEALHNFKLVPKDDDCLRYDVFVDGQKMNGVTSATVIVSASDQPMIPRVCLTFLADHVDIDLPKSDITKTEDVR